MTKRFRMIAGPNGSGKSTLMRWLSRDFAVNFYEILNADDIFSEVRQTGGYQPRFPISEDELVAYAEASSYADEVKLFFRSRQVEAVDDCVRFSPAAVSSYTVALLTNFLQSICIREGRSFSQETVFSHPSKVQALKCAYEAGFRTYLYYVATSSPLINVARVANRLRQGGHDVPPEKINARFARSLSQVPVALPFLSRAFFFDNGGDEMRFLAQWDREAGFSLASQEARPRWFDQILSKGGLS